MNERCWQAENKEMAEIQKNGNTKAGEDIEQQEFSFVASEI